MLALAFAVQGMIRAFCPAKQPQAVTYGGELEKAHKRIAELEKRLYGAKQ